LLVSLLCLLLFQRSSLLLGVCLGLAWASLVLQHRLADRLDPALNGSTLLIEGRVLGLPEHGPEFTRFRFQALAGPQATKLPSQLLTYWYRDAPPLQPGETWRLELRLRPPWGPVNFQGGDRERWLFAEGIGGLATVRSGTRLQAAHWLRSGWDGWRQAARSHIDLAVADGRNRSIVSALAIADSSGMSPQDRTILAVTGTAHLMAISGLNISLAAWFGFWFARLLFLALPLRWAAGRAYALALAVGLVLAVLYAGLAGFGTATLRALLMLATGTLVLLRRRQVHPGQALLLALAGVLVVDPPALLGAGFWLSFSAVGVLIFLFAGGGATRPGHWRGLLQAQSAIMLVLLPLSAWWFQQASEWLPHDHWSA
jgi:competence protein ComEC